jgi:hypothetical protein
VAGPSSQLAMTSPGNTNWQKHAPKFGHKKTPQAIKIKKKKNQQERIKEKKKKAG